MDRFSQFSFFLAAILFSVERLYGLKSTSSFGRQGELVIGFMFARLVTCGLFLSKSKTSSRDQFFVPSVSFYWALSQLGLIAWLFSFTGGALRLFFFFFFFFWYAVIHRTIIALLGGAFYFLCLFLVFFLINYTCLSNFDEPTVVVMRKMVGFIGPRATRF